MVAKPTKPSETLPSSFGGIKTNFDPTKIENGYEPDVPDILGGANLNYLLDTLGKRDSYYETITDFINEIPIGNTITVDNNNQLTYANPLTWASRKLGEIVQTIIPITDAGFHLLDGALISGNGMYNAFVNYISGLVLTYPNLFVTEETWQQQVSTYGVCGKFVYDNINNTVRLPKITGMVEGTTDLNALGSLIQAGLPQHTHSGTTASGDKPHTHTRGTMNITGTLSGENPNQTGYWAGITGAFYKTAKTNTLGNDSNDNDNARVGFDASRSWTGATSSESIAHTHTYITGNASNTIYGKSATVQPQTTKVFYYIVISTATKTDIEVDIDEIATDVNMKADLGLSNINETGQAKFDAKVNKSGDTMTGALTIEAVGSGTDATQDNCRVYLKNSLMDVNATPSENLISSFTFTDKYGNLTGACYNRQRTNGVSDIRLAVYKNDKSALLAVGLDANDIEYFSFPKCSTPATTTSSATNSRVAVIVENYVNGTSWYRVWSDGWIEQGGRVLATGTTYHSGVKVSLLKSFSNNNYSITLGMETDNDGGGIDFQDTGYFNKAKNSFYVRMENTDFMTSLSWEAKGY